MNVSRFQSQHDRFPLLEWIAQFDFKTRDSISFLVGEGKSFKFSVLGQVEVHHPCISEFESGFQVHLRACLPLDCLTLEKMTEVIKVLYAALEIPEQVSHMARFYVSGPRAFVVQNFEAVAYTAIL